MTKDISLLLGGLVAGVVLMGAIAAMSNLGQQPATSANSVSNPIVIGTAATSPGTGGGITEATGLAKDCIVDLYGATGQVPRGGSSKASVDDTIGQCVKARGGQIVTGGKCDPSAMDNCSNTFADMGQDPDSDPMAIVFDVLDASGVVTGDLFVTQGAQVLGSAAGGNCVPAAECGSSSTVQCPASKPCFNNGRCQALCPEGDPGSGPDASCQKKAVDKCRAGELVGCEMGRCIQEGVQACLGREVRARECPGGDGGEVTCKESLDCPSEKQRFCSDGQSAVQATPVCTTPQGCKEAGGIAYGSPATCIEEGLCSDPTHDKCWLPSNASPTYVCAASSPVCTGGGGGGPAPKCEAFGVCSIDMSDGICSCDEQTREVCPFDVDCV